MRLLVVEDDKKVASFVCKGLQQEGYAVDTVHDGAEGAYRANAIDYDAVVLDLMLPKMSGLEVLRQIRKKKPKLPVLVLTAKGDVPDRIAGLDSGADDYMAKPFAFAELSARIRALLYSNVSCPVRQFFGSHHRQCRHAFCAAVGNSPGQSRRHRPQREAGQRRGGCRTETWRFDRRDQ